MTEDRAYMRQSLIPSLLNTIIYNKSRKMNDLSFFEIGKVYTSSSEVMHLAGAFNGLFASSKWQGYKTPVDFFLVKGILEILFEKLILSPVFEAYPNLKNMHPGRTAKIIVDGKMVGFVGEVHPRYAHDHSCDNRYVFELNLDEIYDCNHQAFKYQTICKFPSVSRDLAIVVDKNVTCKEICDVIKMTSKKYLTNLEVFDLYEGENVKENEKSLAISLTFEDKEKTLETADVDKIINSILNRLDALLHAHLR